MSDPTMPAGLAALLQEPGWEQWPGEPVIWTIDVGCEVVVAVAASGAVAVDIQRHRCSCKDGLEAAYRLQERIEAALAQEGTVE